MHIGEAMEEVEEAVENVKTDREGKQGGKELTVTLCGAVESLLLSDQTNVEPLVRESIENSLKNAVVSYVIEQNIVAFEETVFADAPPDKRDCGTILLACLATIGMYTVHVILAILIVTLGLIGSCVVALAAFFVLIGNAFTCFMVRDLVKAFKILVFVLKLSLKLTQIFIITIIRPPESVFMFKLWSSLCCSCCARLNTKNQNLTYEEKMEPSRQLRKCVDLMLDV
eukprot:CAMPEP_0167780816 /NCGR_PEP_ID=MMETSP0111_2-20121227/5574_1 /TAXON_ID=91324 /ORGANISM="Lotharella globosa, Strain CCCM811" /LENGTH=226 /DNA_ID=CAMNT_0007671383 /DNA_START=109 /DNA_END=786 /DNA_ORIENTATION=+